MPKILEGIEERVIKVADKLFSTYFYLNVETRMIAKESGVSVGTLYNYFPTKQDIFLAVVDRKFEKIEIELGKSLNGKDKFEEKMYLYISKLYQLTEKSMKLHRSLTYLFIIEDEVVLKHSQNVHAKFQNLMRNTLFPVISEEYPTITEEDVRKILTVMRASILFFIRRPSRKKEDDKKDIEMLYGILMDFLKNDKNYLKGENNV